MPFLDDVLRATRARVAETKTKVTEEVLEQRIASVARPRGFHRALDQPGMSLIAEIKRATPSAGPLDLDLDASALAAAYARGGASAISVLTEPEFFHGSLEDLAAARGPGLPVLRKDFIVDPFQIFEARAWGADAVLLIARVVGDDLDRLYRTCSALEMDALVEVFDDEDLDRALDARAGLIGVNHRDLETFEVDPDRTAKFASRVPEGTTLVGLSGVSERADVETLEAAGAHAVLVGESLVTAADPAAKIAELLRSRSAS